MTTNRQPLTEEQTAIIKNDYLAGQKPAAIAKKIGAKVGTIRQVIWRQGLTVEKSAIMEAAARTAGEVLEDARQRHAEKLTGIMDKQIESLEKDAERLCDGWPLVEDAAGTSSLMRAKALLQDRTLRHFGLHGCDKSESGGAPTLSMYFVRGEPIDKREPKPVEPVIESIP